MRFRIEYKQTGSHARWLYWRLWGQFFEGNPDDKMAELRSTRKYSDFQFRRG